jgi:hypothetical protein
MVVFEEDHVGAGAFGFFLTYCNCSRLVANPVGEISDLMIGG